MQYFTLILVQYCHMYEVDQHILVTDLEEEENKCMDEVQQQQAIHDWLTATAGVTQQQCEDNPLTEQLKTHQHAVVTLLKTARAKVNSMMISYYYTMNLNWDMPTLEH